MSTALIQEVKTAIGFKQQADLVTPLTASNMVSLRQTNTDLIQATPVNEDDTNDLGKGVYATQTFASHFLSSGPWNGRMTSQAMALLSAFGIGKVVKTSTAATGGFLYTIHEPTFATDGLNLPPTTMAVQIRTSTDAITDKAIVGCVCEEFGINFRQGPGRDNATFTSSWVGTGQNAKPSTITIPAPYAETSLNAGGITALTLLGFDYLANKRFVNFDFKWKNNLRDQSSYYPGSGSQSGYQIRGRMRRGAPTLSLNVQVECDSGSSEEDALLAQTSGTGIVTCLGPQIASGPEHHQWKITLYKLIAKATPIADADGIATYNMEYFILQDTVNGVMKIEAITDIDNILAIAP